MKGIWMCVCGIHPTKSERKGYWRNGVTQFPNKTIYLRISWNILEYLTNFWDNSTWIWWNSPGQKKWWDPSPPLYGWSLHPYALVKMVTWGYLGMVDPVFFFNICYSCLLLLPSTHWKSILIIVLNIRFCFRSTPVYSHGPWHCDHPRSSKMQISAIGGGQLVTAICFPLLAPQENSWPWRKINHKYQRWWVDLGGYTKW